MRGYMALAAAFGVFCIVAAVNGDWAVAGLAYLDAVGSTALAAVERTRRSEA